VLVRILESPWRVQSQLCHDHSLTMSSPLESGVVANCASVTRETVGLTDVYLYFTLLSNCRLRAWSTALQTLWKYGCWAQLPGLCDMIGKGSCRLRSLIVRGTPKRIQWWSTLPRAALNECAPGDRPRPSACLGAQGTAHDIRRKTNARIHQQRSRDAHHPTNEGRNV
jgi:hypothetical protein